MLDSTGFQFFTLGPEGFELVLPQGFTAQQANILSIHDLSINAYYYISPVPAEIGETLVGFVFKGGIGQPDVPIEITYANNFGLVDTVKTDSNGRWEAFLQKGVYDLTIRHREFLPRRVRNIELLQGLNLFNLKSGLELFGEIKDFYGQLVNGFVRVFEQGNIISNAESILGQYSVDVEPDKAYTFVFDAPGFSSARKVVTT